ncbi:DUF2975 domain-containing protein [Patescibacteria group bacterium]|nr:DUF2975 domain-containing protein [Patescibacteria group bacterium]MBP9709621.1 DUF2975 domain-containing protein [Patescibacteria group bacterium]
MTKHVSTHFLRAILFLITLGTLAFCVFALPAIWKSGARVFPTVRYSVYLISIDLYLTVIPFFVALWQAGKLLRYIDQNNAFSQASVKALRTIKQCAIAITVLYVGAVPLLFPIADSDDAPGLLIIGAVIACAPLVMAVFAAVLEQLLQSAIAITSENELTV